MVGGYPVGGAAYWIGNLNLDEVCINSQQNSKPQTSTNELESTSVDTGPVLLQLFQEPPGGSLGCGRNLKLWMFMHALDPDPKIHETSSNIQVRNQGHPCQTSSGYDVQWHRDIHPASLDIFTLYLLHPGCIYFQPTYERRLLFKLIWKAAFVWVTPYVVQLTFSLEACSWKNGDLVFQRWSFFSTLETCMGIDDPYVKKPRWRRNWNAISKMIKDGLAEGMVTRKLCVEVLDLVLTSFQTSFFQGIMNRNVPTRLESTWLD